MCCDTEGVRGFTNDYRNSPPPLLPPLTSFLINVEKVTEKSPNSNPLIPPGKICWDYELNLGKILLNTNNHS